MEHTMVIFRCTAISTQGIGAFPRILTFPQVTGGQNYQSTKTKLVRTPTCTRTCRCKLVGGKTTILKNMKVKWKGYPIYDGKKKHVPNHQPVNYSNIPPPTSKSLSQATRIWIPDSKNSDSCSLMLGYSKNSSDFFLLLKSMFQNENAEHQTWPSPNRSAYSSSNMSNLDVSNHINWLVDHQYHCEVPTIPRRVYPTRWCPRSRTLSWFITPITMVFIGDISIVFMGL